MYTRILVPIDGSATSLCALKHAKSLGKAYGAGVIILYVIDPYPFTGVGTDLAYGQAQYIEESNAQAKQALENARKECEEAGVDAQVLSVEGSIVQNSIAQVVEAQGVDLIVMASHGRSGLEKFLLGSTTDRVLGTVQVPVLVVKRKEADEEDANPHNPHNSQGLAGGEGNSG